MRDHTNTHATRFERNPNGAKRQCTASAGKAIGRCPNESTKRYAQRQPRGDGTDRIVWMNRCDAHPMSNAAGVEPIDQEHTP